MFDSSWGYTRKTNSSRSSSFFAPDADTGPSDGTCMRISVLLHCRFDIISDFFGRDVLLRRHAHEVLILAK